MQFSELERVMGIEPTYAAWEAAVLPLNYTRTDGARIMRRRRFHPAPRPSSGRSSFEMVHRIISPGFGGPLRTH